MQPNIKDFSLAEFASYLSEQGEPVYRARQVCHWLFQKRATSFAEMTNLPAAFRKQLQRNFEIVRLGMQRRLESRDGTVKFLFALSDGENIETVLIPEPKRLTLCISTQAGCGFGCAFCATALLGLKRNLSSGEIVDQVLEASRTLPAKTRITNLVLMGMGEPLANYAQTLKALDILTNATWGIGFSPRRITLSTVGLVPQIHKLMDETGVNLAISLHAPSDQLRARLMPVNRKYSLKELMECCRSLPLPRRKRITFEYVLLQDVNDSAQHARELCELLRGIRCKVNVIPFNPHTGSIFQRPSDERIEVFRLVLYQQGVQVNIRRPRGDEIAAACGQLRGEEHRILRARPAMAGQA